VSAVETYPAALYEYAAGSRVDHFASWCREHCRQSIGQFAGEPLELEPWQFRFMAEAMAVDEDEAPYWRVVVLLVPRKNGKTTMLAARAGYELDIETDEPEVLLAAASDKQAGRLYDGASGFLRRSPELRDRFVYRDYIGEIARADGGGKILRMATKAATMHGYNPSLGIIDELHAWTAPSMRSAFGAMMTAGGARKRTQMFAITTAGEGDERETSILGMLVDRNERDGETEAVPGLTISRNHAARTIVYNYSAPTTDPQDVAAMKLANPASWITEAYLERQAADPSLSVAQVLQLHGCVWASSDDAFVTLERWRELGDPVAGVIEPGASVCIGFDGSRTYDTTVAAWASLMPDGRIAVKSHVWSTRREAPHHEHVPGEIDFARFERYVERDLFGRFTVLEGAYDPRYLVRSVQLLRDRLPGSRIAEVEPMSRLMRDALATFYQLVVDGRIVHDGDPVLAAHVAAARAEQDEKGWIVRKRHQARPIDALIAVVLAVWRCSMTAHAATPFYMEWE